jgi:hypothetical protein
MSISNAFKEALEIIKSEEYQTYVAALGLYKNECKRWSRIKKAFSPDSEEANEALQFFMGQHRHRKACVTYHKARAVYESWRIKRITRELSPKEIMNLLGQKVPTNIKDLIKEAEVAKRAANVSPEQFEQIKNAAIQHSLENQTTKERFLSNNTNDPTANDFEPLPVIEEEESKK